MILKNIPQLSSDYWTAQLLSQLQKTQSGRLTLVLPNAKQHVIEGRYPGPIADLSIHRWSSLYHCFIGGDVGFCEQYQKGELDSSDLTEVFAFFLANENAFSHWIFGSKIIHWVEQLRYRFQANTVNGSKKNILAHYDLGNSFYQLWLDPSMTYSSAIFGDTVDLETAQKNKYARIFDKLNCENKSILEIGCGWGGFADYALSNGAQSWQGITISDEQHRFAAQRLAKFGDKADLQLKDYRLVDGQFDRIVSIEMFEAVGQEFWHTYFQSIAKQLKPDGIAMIQTITIDETRFEQYAKSSDAIRTYIFPGGLLPSIERFEQSANSAGLRVVDRFAFGQDYAQTLNHWLTAFERQKTAIMSLGFDERFIRLWRFYLTYCIAAFRSQRTNVYQIELRHASQ